MIKAILFDFDGVLTIDKTGSTSITKYIAEQTGLPLSSVKDAYYKFNKALLYGKLTHPEMWQEFCELLQTAIDYQVLTDSFIHTALDEKMVNLLKTLKSRYRIGLITDNKRDRIDAIIRHHGWEDLFDVVAVSADLHSGKEQPEIFRYVFEQLSLSPEECVFIDNTAKNLVVPETLGMHTVLFDDERRDVRAFEQTLRTLLGE